MGKKKSISNTRAAIVSAGDSQPNIAEASQPNIAEAFVVTMSDNAHAPRYRRGDSICVGLVPPILGDEVLCDTGQGIVIGRLADSNAEKLTLTNTCQLPIGGNLFTVVAGRYWRIEGVLHVPRNSERRRSISTPDRTMAARRQTLTLVTDAVSRDTVECLEALLDDAKRGKVIGITFAAMLSGRMFETDTAGECSRNPVFARGMVATLDDELRDMVRQ